MPFDNYLGLIHHHLPGALPLLLVIIGAVMGSFITCAVHRVPRGESLWYPSSQCPSCGVRLGVLDLVPVFSWLWSRGRCRHCRAVIPVRYLLLELASIGLLLSAFYLIGPHMAAFVAGALLLSLMFVAVCWWQERHLSLWVLLFSLMLSALLACLY